MPVGGAQHGVQAGGLPAREEQPGGDDDDAEGDRGAGGGAPSRGRRGAGRRGAGCHCAAPLEDTGDDQGGHERHPRGGSEQVHPEHEPPTPPTPNVGVHDLPEDDGQEAGRGGSRAKTTTGTPGDPHHDRPEHDERPARDGHPRNPGNPGEREAATARGEQAQGGPGDAQPQQHVAAPPIGHRGVRGTGAAEHPAASPEDDHEHGHHCCGDGEQAPLSGHVRQGRHRPDADPGGDDRRTHPEGDAAGDLVVVVDGDR